MSVTQPTPTQPTPTQPTPTQPTLFKIMTREEFAEFDETGGFAGSPDDQRDGFIHLCHGEQLEQTIDAHFRGRGELALLELDASQLTEHLALEPSRGGALFPHLYRPLLRSDVIRQSWHAAVPDSDLARD